MCRPHLEKVVRTRQFFCDLFFLRCLFEIELSLQCRAHFVDLIFKKWSEPVSFFTILMWNRALATVSCTFCRTLFGSRRETAETDTLQRWRPRTATLPEKTQGFAPESLFSREFTRSRSLTHDDMVDMMVRQLAVTIVRNSEDSQLNFLWSTWEPVCATPSFPTTSSQDGNPQRGMVYHPLMLLYVFDFGPETSRNHIWHRTCLHPCSISDLNCLHCLQGDIRLSTSYVSTTHLDAAYKRAVTADPTISSPRGWMERTNTTRMRLKRFSSLCYKTIQHMSWSHHQQAHPHDLLSVFLDAPSKLSTLECVSEGALALW